MLCCYLPPLCFWVDACFSGIGLRWLQGKIVRMSASVVESCGLELYVQRREQWRVRGVLWRWLWNDERRLRECALIYKLWTVNLLIRTVNCTLQMKTALEMMREQVEQLENWVQMRCIWQQNEQLDGPWRCPWDQEPGLIWPKWPQGGVAQFRHSILEEVFIKFWKILETKIVTKNEAGFPSVFWIELVWKIDGFWYQIRTKLR